MNNTVFLSIIWALPVVFMLHDFEEIILMERWSKKNSASILKKYPRMSKGMGNNLSTAGFALAVYVIFTLLSLITLAAVVFDWYYLWFGIAVGFGLHLVVHIFQWIILKKYIPAVVTSFPALVYSVYAVVYVYKSTGMGFRAAVLWSAAGLLLVVAVLVTALAIAGRFDKLFK